MCLNQANFFFLILSEHLLQLKCKGHHNTLFKFALKESLWLISVLKILILRISERRIHHFKKSKFLTQSPEFMNLIRRLKSLGHSNISSLRSDCLRVIVTSSLIVIGVPPVMLLLLQFWGRSHCRYFPIEASKWRGSKFEQRLTTMTTSLWIQRVLVKIWALEVLFSLSLPKVESLHWEMRSCLLIISNDHFKQMKVGVSCLRPILSCLKEQYHQIYHFELYSPQCRTENSLIL